MEPDRSLKLKNDKCLNVGSIRPKFPDAIIETSFVSNLLGMFFGGILFVSNK